MKTKKIKHWGGLSCGRTPHVYVAAHSQKQAVELLNLTGLNMTLGELRNYFGGYGLAVERTLPQDELGVWECMAEWPKEGDRFDRLVDAQGNLIQRITR